MRIARERKPVMKEMQKNGYINASKYIEHEVFKKKITNLREKRTDKEKDNQKTHKG